MAKVAKSLVAVALMGIPVWVVVGILAREKPATLFVYLPETDVRVWIGEQEIWARSTTLGPIEVSPGEHTLRVTRGDETLYSYPLSMDRGERKEVRVYWNSRKVLSPRGESVLSDVDERRFEGHWGIVSAVGYSRDGRYVVSAGDEGKVRVWDAIEGREIGVLKGHAGKVVAVGTLADELQVLTVGDDGTVRSWDPSSGRETRNIDTRSGGAIRCAAISPDGRRVALSSELGAIRILDLESNTEIGSRTTAPASTGGLAFSPDGRTLLIGLVGDAQTASDVIVLDVPTGRVLNRLRGHEEPVWAVAFLPDGRRAVSAGSDRTLRLWDVGTGNELRRFDDHPGVVLCVSVSPDGRRALTGTGHLWSGGWKPAASYGMQLWDLETGVGLGRFETGEPVRTLALSPDGRRVLAGGDDRIIHSWAMPNEPSREEIQPGAG